MTNMVPTLKYVYCRLVNLWSKRGLIVGGVVFFSVLMICVLQSLPPLILKSKPNALYMLFLFDVFFNLLFRLFLYLTSLSLFGEN